MKSERRAPAHSPSPANLLAALRDLGGAGLSVTEIGGGEPPPPGPGVVRVGVDRRGVRPDTGIDRFDILLSSDPAAPRPWVGTAPERLEATITELRAAATLQPAAATVAAQVLRMSLQVTFDQALALESLAYSMLLASEGFRSWRIATPARDRPDDGADRVLVDRDGAVIRIRLNRPAARNAFDARMRDELAEALEFAAADPDRSDALLTGAGSVFSAGGDLDEFGRADDPGRAHLIRALRSPARLAHQLGDRLTARVHGACIGAGIEVPAAAARVVAAPGAFFRLPEVSMGLIPGAGGTVSIPRRIGRQRACYMAISGAAIDLRTALAWGLVDAVEGA